jgi:hypothetical protein
MRLTSFNTTATFILVISALLSACSGAPTYNATTFPFQMDKEKLEAADIKTVIISHINLGSKSRNYLEKEEARIDAKVAAYLKENGYKVLPQRTFEQHWNTAERVYGTPLDPTTGKINRKTFAQIMHSVRDALAKSSDLDAFIFTDIVEMQTSFSGGMKHLARWDGVTRKPSLQGPGNSVSADFDWNMEASAASMQITIFNMELEPMFSSRGGMDATDAIDTRSSAGRYIRRRNILESDNNVMEGIQIALHPFIEFEGWPGNP